MDEQEPWVCPICGLEKYSETGKWVHLDWHAEHHHSKDDDYLRRGAAIVNRHTRESRAAGAGPAAP